MWRAHIVRDELKLVKVSSSVTAINLVISSQKIRLDLELKRWTLSTYVLAFIFFQLDLKKKIAVNLCEGN